MGSLYTKRKKQEREKSHSCIPPKKAQSPKKSIFDIEETLISENESIVVGEYSIIGISEENGNLYNRYKDDINQTLKYHESTHWVIGSNYWEWKNINNNQSMHLFPSIQMLYDLANLMDEVVILNPLGKSINLYFQSNDDPTGSIESTVGVPIQIFRANTAKEKYNYYLIALSNNIQSIKQSLESIIENSFKPEIFTLYKEPPNLFMQQYKSFAEQLKQLYDVEIVSIKGTQIELKGFLRAEGYIFICIKLAEVFSQISLLNKENIPPEVLSFNESQYPKYWENTKMVENSKKLKIPLNSDIHGEEWNRIEEQVMLTLPSVKIIKIERVENLWTWNHYKIEKEMMIAQIKNANERYLFHGTGSVNPETIVFNQSEGLSVIHSKKGRFGKGIYLSYKASYSNNFSYKTPMNTRIMFVVKALLGEVYECNETYEKKDLPMNEANNRRYDSICNDIDDSEIYMVKRNNQVHIEYIMTYEVD